MRPTSISLECSLERLARVCGSSSNLTPLADSYAPAHLVDQRVRRDRSFGRADVRALSASRDAPGGVATTFPSRTTLSCPRRSTTLAELRNNTAFRREFMRVRLPPLGAAMSRVRKTHSAITP